MYAYALGAISDEKFIDEYPLVRKPQNLSYADVKADNRYSLYCPNLGFQASTGNPGSQETETDLTKPKTTINVKPPSNPAASCDKVAIATQIPDEQFLHQPSCIICMRDKYGVFRGRVSTLMINPKLRLDLHGGWLLNEHDPDLSDAIPLGRYRNHDLFIRRIDQWKLSEFTLFVLTATAQSTIGTAAAAAGGPSGGGGASKKPGPQAVPTAPAPVPTLPLGAPLVQ